MRSLIPCRLLPVAALCLWTAHAAVAAPTYRIEQVGKAHGALPRTADAVSDNGSVTGLAKDSQTGQTLKFVSRKGGTIQVLTQSRGPTFAGYADVNNTGTVVGRYNNGSGEERGGMWSSDGTLTDLGELVGCADPRYAYPRAINKAGTVLLGLDCDIDGVHFHGGALLRDGVRTMMPALDGGPTYVSAVNSGGQVTGSSEVQLGGGNSVQQAFIWQDGQEMRPLGRRGDESSGIAINDKGHVIGVVADNQPTRPFLYKGGALLELPKCEGEDRLFWPVAIGNDDSIVGHYQWSGLPTQTGLIQNGECKLLGSLLDESGAGWTDLSVHDMNNNGVIVGAGRYQGHPRSFIATPLSR